MAFTREQVEDFIAALHNDAELRERVRGAILSDDFQALPRAMERLTERLETLIAATDMRFEKLETRMERVEKRLDDIAGKLGNVEGDVFEGRFIRNVRSNIGPRFRRPRPLDVYSDEALESAMAKAPLSDSELKDIATADLLVWTTDTESMQDAALVIEVSRAIDVGDVVRAQRRAGLLAKTGLNAIPVVAGASVSEEAKRTAHRLSVVTIVQRSTEGEPAA